MKQIEIRANGIRYAALEQGEGPLVLLLHGFPDNAHSWEYQMSALAKAGYRAVAVWLRGYPPTEIPAGGYYDRATLALDIKCLIEVLNDGKPAFLVAQDWGAAIAYGVLGAFPETVKRAVLLAIPHPLQIRKSMRSIRHIVRAFHWWMLQLPGLPEVIVKARNYAFIEFLWKLWSPDYRDHQHVAQIKKMLAQPGALPAALGYYRAALQRRHQGPSLAELRSKLDRSITVPTLVLCGSDDIRSEHLEPQRPLFAGLYEWAIIEGCGHFLHREKPDEVNRHILRWLSASSVC